MLAADSALAGKAKPLRTQAGLALTSAASGSLFPVVYLNALFVAAVLCAPPDVGASTDHHHIGVLDHRNRCVVGEFQPRCVRLHAGPGWSQLIVDNPLIEPIVGL